MIITQIQDINFIRKKGIRRIIIRRNILKNTLQDLNIKILQIKSLPIKTLLIMRALQRAKEKRESILALQLLFDN